MEIQETNCRRIFDDIIDYSHGRLERIEYGYVLRGIEGKVKDSISGQVYKIVIEPEELS